VLYDGVSSRRPSSLLTTIPIIKTEKVSNLRKRKLMHFNIMHFLLLVSVSRPIGSGKITEILLSQLSYIIVLGLHLFLLLLCSCSLLKLMAR